MKKLNKILQDYESTSSSDMPAFQHIPLTINKDKNKDKPFLSRMDLKDILDNYGKLIGRKV